MTLDVSGHIKNSTSFIFLPVNQKISIQVVLCFKKISIQAKSIYRGWYVPMVCIPMLSIPIWYVYLWYTNFLTFFFDDFFYLLTIVSFRNGVPSILFLENSKQITFFW